MINEGDNLSMKKTISKVMLMITLLLCLSGCGKNYTEAEIQLITTPISEITVPDTVKIIGLGEATHGNVELQLLKKEVFEAVLKNNGCRIFAIEGDFGGAYKVNEYIHGGEGTAKEAVSELGFAIYRTKEMEQIIQWMRDYNEQVPEEEKIIFYGFDMQRYDNSKKILFHFLEQVGFSNWQDYEATLSLLNDETVYDQKESNIKQAKKSAEDLQQKLLDKESSYAITTGFKEYELAKECLKAIIENATLQTSGSNYSTLRDQYMKERIKWIYDYEEQQKIFIAAHDGHIDKSSAVKGYTSMGKLLAEDFKDSYFAIGTDFLKGEVNVVTTTGKRTNYAVRNKNGVTSLFKEGKENTYYLDFAKAESIEEIDKILNKKQRMINIGAQFDFYQKFIKSFYTLNMVPKKSYDSIIVIKNVTPTKVQPLPELEN